MNLIFDTDVLSMFAKVKAINLLKKLYIDDNVYILIINQGGEKSMTIQEMVIAKAKAAKESANKLATASSEVKNEALNLMAKALEDRAEEIIKENAKDLEYAKEKNLSSAMIDRLTLNPKRIAKMADGLREVAMLPDPVGRVTAGWRRPNGILIEKVTVPLGVIGFIYESRPNVTADAAALCLKSGNAVILRGGSEAINSNIIITHILDEATGETGIPRDVIQTIETTDRAAVNVMLKLNEYLSLIIPRGGKGLIKTVVENATVPVIKHYEGVCHTYVDKDADLEMAYNICFNAKVQRPGVCNAMETMLVHKDIAGDFLPTMASKLRSAGVEMRGCAETKKILSDIKEATEEDWSTEYLDLILSIRIVNDLDEAIEHIVRYGSQHSDGIVSTNYNAVHKFMEKVDSAAVFANCSTRLHDGFEFGLGAEIGISTDKLHARGPMALEELTSYKYIVWGEGQIRR